MNPSMDGLYAIVKFCDENLTCRTLDLVPSSWVQENTCQYPDESDYKYIDEWLVNLKKPEKEWDYFAIEVIAYAKDIKQGKRRLKRALKSEEFTQTDDGCIKNSSNKMTIDMVKKTLDAIKPFQPCDKLSSTPLNFLLSDQLNIKKPAETCSQKENIENILDMSIVVGDANVDVLNVQPILENDFAEKEYIQSKLDAMEKRILKKIHNTKRSILYDIEKKMNEIKHTILLNCTGAKINVTPDGMEKIKNDLNVTLPTATLEEFLQFEYSLENSQDQRESLISLFRILVANDTAVKDSIAKTMGSVMSKAVELEYSGTGKIIKGKGKRNFSSTHTYVCLRDVLIQKYGNILDIKKLPGQVGMWLSRAGDREGGRKQR